MAVVLLAKIRCWKPLRCGVDVSMTVDDGRSSSAVAQVVFNICGASAMPSRPLLSLERGGSLEKKEKVEEIKIFEILVCLFKYLTEFKKILI